MIQIIPYEAVIHLLDWHRYFSGITLYVGSS